MICTVRRHVLATQRVYHSVPKMLLFYVEIIY